MSIDYILQYNNILYQIINSVQNNRFYDIIKGIYYNTLNYLRQYVQFGVSIKTPVVVKLFSLDGSVSG